MLKKISWQFPPRAIHIQPFPRIFFCILAKYTAIMHLENGSDRYVHIYVYKVYIHTTTHTHIYIYKCMPHIFFGAHNSVYLASCINRSIRNEAVSLLRILNRKRSTRVNRWGRRGTKRNRNSTRKTLLNWCDRNLT